MTTKLYKNTLTIADVMQAYVAFRNGKAYKPTPEQERDFVQAYNACADVGNARLTAANAFKALNEFVGMDNITVEVVGSWIRIQGNTYPIRDRIKAYGTAIWNKKFKTWQIVNVEKRGNGKGMTDATVKAKHGTVTAVKTYRKATA